jgi:hypothetical protein
MDKTPEADIKKNSTMYQQRFKQYKDQIAGKTQKRQNPLFIYSKKIKVVERD